MLPPGLSSTRILVTMRLPDALKTWEWQYKNHAGEEHLEGREEILEDQLV